MENTARLYYPLLPFLFHMAEGRGIKNAGKTLNIKDEYNNLGSFLL